MRALLCFAALSMGGCATVPGERSGYVCTSEIRDGLHVASSVYRLDSRGEYRSGQTSWFRGRGSDSVDARAEWKGQDLPDREQGSYTFRIVTDAFPSEVGQVRLFSKAGSIDSSYGTGPLRFIRVNGKQLASLRDGTDGLGIWAVNRRDQLMGGSGITWADLDRGVELARQANARSLAASTDHRRSCQRQQEEPSA